jgi:hypothetical protein
MSVVLAQLLCAAQDMSESQILNATEAGHAGGRASKYL